MKNLKTTGIVIGETSLGDSDKILTILTPNVGKITCVAKGAKRPKSLLMAGSQLLCFGEYVLHKTNDMYNIQTSDPIEVFYNIRTDLDKLNYVATIIKIINDVTTENQNNYNVLKLLLNTLYIISETDVDKDFILSVFELRLMVLLGYSPMLGKCVSCGSPENICYFSIAHSGFLCNNCGRVDKSAIQITKDTFDALKYICTAPAKKIYSFNISDESKKELQIISSLYLNKNLDKDYKFEKLF